MMYKFFALSFIVSSLFYSAYSQKLPKQASNIVSYKYLNRLRCWAGEYPIDRASKPAKNFFNLSEVKQPLIRLLSATGYRRLLKDFVMVVPIQMIEGHLVLEGNTGKTQPEPEYALVAVNIYTGEIHVGFSGSGDEKAEWFSSFAISKFPTKPPVEVQIKIDAATAKEHYRQMCAAYNCNARQ